MTSEGPMPDQTRTMLVQLMESQAYRELAAAHMFGVRPAVRARTSG